MGKWECELEGLILSIGCKISTAGGEQGDLVNPEMDAPGGKEYVCANHILLCLLLPA